MPTQSYALELGGPRRIEVSWEGNYDNFGVKFDGQIIGTVIERNKLFESQTFALPDGSTLSVSLSGLVPELRLLRNNQLLPELQLLSHVKTAGAILFVLGGAIILVGVLILYLQHTPRTSDINFAVSALVLGAILEILTIFVLRRSLVALILATVLWASVLPVAWLTGQGEDITLTVIGVWLAFLFPFAQGIRAGWMLRRATQSQAPPQ